jgi:hypothetical protein
MFSAYACAVVGIPQALLGMANALAAALPWRKGPPNGPAALRVSAIRQGVTGTKLKPVGVVLMIDLAEAVLPVPPFTKVTAGAAPMGTGVAVGEGLGTEVKAAEGRDRGAGMGLGVPKPPPPQPTKENAIRDKQMNARQPEAQNESWRRIVYLSAI